MNLRRIGPRAMPLAALGIAGMLVTGGSSPGGVAALQTGDHLAAVTREASTAGLVGQAYPGASGGLARLVREAMGHEAVVPFGSPLGSLVKDAAGVEPLGSEALTGRTRAVSRVITSEALTPFGTDSAGRQLLGITREAIVAERGVSSNVADRSAVHGAFAGSASPSRGASGDALDLASVQDPIQPAASAAGLGREAAASSATVAYRLSWPDDSVTLGLAGNEAMPVPPEPAAASETERQAIKASVQNVDVGALTSSISATEREAAQRAAGIVATAALADAALPFERQAAREAAGLDIEAGAMMATSSLEREAAITVAGSRSLEGLAGGSSVQPEGASGIEREASTSGQGALNDAAASARDAGRATLEEAMQ
ncbi:MAG: hypothetical protein KatS3mg059_1527 [Thermomicrobiales bacterium]|nr:MAG: hypothetical protein KatS3mg059_1527 [Thermomicrobiales bacterium]